MSLRTLLENPIENAYRWQELPQACFRLRAVSENAFLKELASSIHLVTEMELTPILAQACESLQNTEERPPEILFYLKDVWDRYLQGDATTHVNAPGVLARIIAIRVVYGESLEDIIEITQRECSFSTSVLYLLATEIPLPDVERQFAIKIVIPLLKSAEHKMALAKLKELT